MALIAGSKHSRNTDAFSVHIGAHWFGFSYSTCVAYCGPLGSCYRKNIWGPTTGRHLNEYGRRGVEVDEATMNERMRQAVMETGLSLWADKLGLEKKDEFMEQALG